VRTLQQLAHDAIRHVPFAVLDQRPVEQWKSDHLCQIGRLECEHESVCRHTRPNVRRCCVCNKSLVWFVWFVWLCGGRVVIYSGCAVNTAFSISTPSLPLETWTHVAFSHGGFPEVGAVPSTVGCLLWSVCVCVCCAHRSQCLWTACCTRVPRAEGRR
jgi:hypothetical protein